MIMNIPAIFCPSSNPFIYIELNATSIKKKSGYALSLSYPKIEKVREIRGKEQLQKLKKEMKLLFSLHGVIFRNVLFALFHFFLLLSRW